MRLMGIGWIILYAIVFTGNVAKADSTALIPGCTGIDSTLGATFEVTLWTDASVRFKWIKSGQIVKEISGSGSYQWRDWHVHLVARIQSGADGYKILFNWLDGPGQVILPGGRIIPFECPPN